MPINYETLTLDTVSKVDGRIARLFERQVNRICDDCRDRPADKKPRKLIVQFSFEPVLDPESRECETVKMSVQVKAKVPDYQSAVYPMVCTHKGGLKFNADLPESHDQQAIGFPNDE